MNIKRIISIFAAVALGAILLPFPAQASVPAHERHRELSHTMTESAFYQQDYETQEAICWAWNTGYEKASFINDLIDAQAGMGMSRADRRYGVVSALNQAC